MGVWAYGRMGVWGGRCVLLAAAVLGLVWFGGCGTPPPPRAAKKATTAPKPSASRPPVSVSIREGELSVSDDSGRPVWKTTGKTIKTDDKKGLATFTDATCQMFDGGTLTLDFHADTIVVNYDAEPQTMTLTGNVVANSPTAGWTFRAPTVTAVYDNKKVQTITAEKDVHLEKANLKIQAATMTTDVRLKRIRMDEAHGILELPALPEQRRKRR